MAFTFDDEKPNIIHISEAVDESLENERTVFSR